MAQTYNGGFIAVNAAGTTVTTGAASAAVNIPTDGSGTNRPNYIRVAATAESYFNVRGVAATTNDILVQPSDAVVIQVPKGVTQVNYIQGAASAKMNIVPLDNS
jgi:hypothetical protein